MKVYTIFPQIAPCSESEPTGRVIEAVYSVESSVVSLTDAEGAPTAWRSAGGSRTSRTK
jgi:hypothetical protein